MATLEKAVAALPDNVPLRLTLAELYRLQLQPTKALRHWREVLAREPTNPRASVGVAERLQAQGRSTDALELLERVVAGHPEVAEVHYRMGHLHYKQKRLDRAAEALHNALKHDPNHVEALNRLAWLYAIQGRNLGEAARMSQLSLEIKPESPIFLDTLAEVRFQRQEYKEALRLIQKAINKAPDKSYYRSRLAKFKRAAKRPISGS